MAELKTILPERMIIPALRSTDYEEVIREMFDFLESQGEVHPDVAEVERDVVLEREEEQGSGVGSGVAIPHARVKGLEKVIAVFGRSAEGANFSSPDNSPCHFICLLLVPLDQAGLHLQTLASLAKLLSRCGVRERLMEASGAAEIAIILADC